MNRNWFMFLLLALSVSSSGNWSLAQPPKTNTSARAGMGDMGEITPAREAAALKFVELNHPELVPLLSALKEADTKEFRKATEDIFRTSERLARLKTKSENRYELELAIWVADSRMNLMIASLPMARDRERVLLEIEATLSRKQQLQIDLLKLDEQAAEQRLTRVRDSIKKMEDERKAAHERQMSRIRKLYPTQTVGTDAEQ
ncbi:MAG: hypothetical protein KDA78_02980 [Planctomycetaceae bacterium]|nr:hypothetical protein [Planctomycetaceae bacterium]